MQNSWTYCFKQKKVSRYTLVFSFIFSINRSLLIQTMSIDLSIENVIDELYKSQFATENVDLQIEDVGKLNYTVGRKLRLKYVDIFENEDVEEWITIASNNGANLSFVVDTSTGNIDLNVEYEYIKHKSHIKTAWIFKFSITLVLMVWSYQQLNEMNPTRYQIPW